MYLLDLPDDVITIINLYLLPRDFLAFCCVSRATYARYHQDSSYWRTKTADTFRIPISPLLAADGQRWYWLYKRLKTQTKLFGWGQDSTPAINAHMTAHGRALILHRRGRRFRPGQNLRSATSSSTGWPTEVVVPKEVQVIADLQCGGYSTAILSSKGELFALGSISGRNIREETNSFGRLTYLTQSTSAIRQFSAGREHILALTDDGEILSWDNLGQNAFKIYSQHGMQFGGKPTRVVAGWAESSAYIPETGIVYWKPVAQVQENILLDGMHVTETTVPLTARKTTEAGTIEVLKHIVLGGYIVWITSDSKLYAYAIGGDSVSPSGSISQPFEVPGFEAPGRVLKDLQGQFQNFGVFTAAGEVLSGNTEFLHRCCEPVRNEDEHSRTSALISFKPPDVPALQHTGVIGLAYGDHHYHALHSNGKITSYGSDSLCCGQLGLSDPETTAKFRGAKRYSRTDDDASLHDIANHRGRQIWFEQEKKDWLEWLDKEMTIASSQPRGEEADLLQNDPTIIATFSEWVEQEGRHWNEGPNISSIQSSLSSIKISDNTSVNPQDTNTSESTSTDYSHLDPYFAITIAAAGWHSAALVLVDEEKANEVRKKWLAIPEPKQSHQEEPEVEKSRSMPGSFEPDLPKEEEEEQGEKYVWEGKGFPKVQLPNGVTMPGSGDPRTWRDGMPSMQQLGFED